MKTGLLIFVFIVTLFWGCAHLDVVRDKIRDNENFYIALAFGLFWIVLGIVGLGCWFATLVLPYFLS